MLSASIRLFHDTRFQFDNAYQVTSRDFLEILDFLRRSSGPSKRNWQAAQVST